MAKRLVTIVKLIFVLTTLCSCQQETETPLRIGSNTWPGYEPLYLARDNGYYKNSSIRLIELLSASDVIHAFRNGNLEGAALTLDETLSLIADGIELKIILVMDFSTGGDVLIAKPEIGSLKQLKGKSIALEYTAVGAILLDSALTAGELTIEDIKMITCPVNEHLICYASSDAIVTFEPISTKLLDKGGKLLFDSRMIPNKIVDVLTVQREVINTHPNSLKRLLTGYFRAKHFLSAFPDEASKNISKRMKLTRARALETFKGMRLPTLEENHQLLSGSPSPIDEISQSLELFMLERKLLKKSIPNNLITDPQFLPVSQ